MLLGMILIAFKLGKVFSFLIRLYEKKEGSACVSSERVRMTMRVMMMQTYKR